MLTTRLVRHELAAQGTSVRRTLALATLAIFATSCTSGVAATEGSPPPIKVIDVPYPSAGPYVVVAVDNHFHDIHFVDVNIISANRAFVLKNEGLNLHNFTVVGTNVNFDIKPGQTVVWPRIGDKVQPGSYTVICKYHAYLGMTGSFIVTPYPESGHIARR